MNQVDALQTAIVCTLILYLKTHFAFIAVGGAKMKAGKRAPEDTYQVRARVALASLSRRCTHTQKFFFLDVILMVSNWKTLCECLPLLRCSTCFLCFFLLFFSFLFFSFFKNKARACVFERERVLRLVVLSRLDKCACACSVQRKSAHTNLTLDRV